MKTRVLFAVAMAVLFTDGLVIAQDTTLTITNTGLVGIGTTTPIEQLEITGNLRLSASTANMGIIKSDSNRFIHNFGQSNFFAGVNAGNLTMTGIGNTGVGFNAILSNTTGEHNTAYGDRSLFSNTVGSYNSANGHRALESNAGGNFNTAIGYDALRANTAGNENTASGARALEGNTTGSQNTALGRSALSGNTEGFRNTALGYSAGGNITTGNTLTLVGYNAEPSTGDATNEITLGNSSVTSLRCAVTNISALSDVRDKKDIQGLSLGLGFISKLKPRQYRWDKREWYEGNKSDGSKSQEAFTAGFIAQELDELQTTEKAEWLNLVLKDNPERFEATPGNLLPVMVKAIQELNSENEALKKRLSDLETIVKSIASVERKSADSKPMSEMR